MQVPIELIKELRRMTAVSIGDCKKALLETGGNIDKATAWLRKRGLEIAAKKQSRLAREGRVESYVHPGNKLGVLLEVDCETDFVAKNSDFCQFTKDVSMQIAACNPSYIKEEDVPPEVIKKEKDKLTFSKEHCLSEQPFVKDPSITIKDYLSSLIAKCGENIVIRRFIRYKIGEE